jgi:DNA-binding NtrC family response regulator
LPSSWNREDKYNVETARSAEEAISKFDHGNFDLIISDYKLPGMNGMELLDYVKAKDPDMPFLILTAFGTIEKAVEAIKKGAYNYLTKPVNTDSLIILTKEMIEKRGLLLENRSLKKELSEKYSFENIISKSKPMQDVFSTIQKISQTDASVLITGESGTGKELIAKAIHYTSLRAAGPFVVINCTTIPIDLMESELFGFEKGAFTCAYAQKIGLLETANKGTIFFDEIGDLDLYLQKKMLRFYQEREFNRLGGNKSIKVDVRIIAATNKNMEDSIKNGEFREDLFYRLNIISIHMPPLRERKEDIPLLIKHFLDKFNKKFSKDIRGFDSSVIDIFMDYDWPGNVRELENTIERAVILCPYDTVTPNYVPKKLMDSIRSNSVSIIGNELNLIGMEKKIILTALDKSGWNQSKAAQILGISRKQLRTKMKNLGIIPD